MVFTLIEADRALVYGPHITGPARCPVFRVESAPGGRYRVEREEGLLQALDALGLPMESVFCGDADPLYEEREQWLSGANSFAFAPGKIIMYSCNLRTLDALSRDGFAIRRAEDFISGAEKVGNFGKLAVTFEGIELARGGGGARCMTLPLERAEP
jgi:arginine deiminase